MHDGEFPQLESSAEDVYQVYQLCYGRDPGRRVHNNFVMVDMHDGPMPVDFNIWILRNRHRTVIVDTGFGPRAAGERGRPLDIDPIDALVKIGIDPDEIEDVVITHLHFDHAGNIDRFGKARFHIQDSEVEFATGRCMCDAFIRRPFDVEDVVALVRKTYAERVVFHNGDDDLLPGLTLHVFPGHSAAVQGVRVNTPRGPVLLASDATHYFANVLNMKPFNLTVDSVATLDSYRRLMALSGGAHRLIPGHDPKIRNLYPAVMVGGQTLWALHEEPYPFDPADLARTDNFEQLAGETS
ncbi:N-acyl homoserine lactonase family protein [Antarctobacter sp.]|uniref:N-acyl homoserine lactonase family protein n=1 Tax=Antarctobacter sp. TaxID=1872577 RepID=UPI003A8DA5B3